MVRTFCRLLAVFTVLTLPISMNVAPGQAAGDPGETREGTPPPAERKARGADESQEEAKEVEYPDTFRPILASTAVPIEKGGFAFQPTFGLGFLTHRFTRSWRRVPTGGNGGFFSMDYQFKYGLGNNLEVYVLLPYVHNWVRDFGRRGRAADFGGIGDINLACKYRLVLEGPCVPTVTALLATDFPTGHCGSLDPVRLGTDEIGGGAYVFTTGLNLSKYVKPFIFYGNFWYSMATDFTNNGGRQHPRDCVTVNLAAEYPLTRKWVALLELTSFWDGGRLFGHRANVKPQALLSLMPGIEYLATKKFSLALGVNLDLAGKNTEAAVTPLLSLWYGF